MKKYNKRKSASEKLEILNFYKLHGAIKASREFNVSVGSIYKWKETYESNGLSGISKSKKEETASFENRRLKRENDELKKLVAEKELEIRIKNEMLKKST